MGAAVPTQRQTAPNVFEDGIGERMAAVGGANESLEVLKVSNELSAVSTFEPALREQAARLAEFRHESFARVRTVERLDARTSTVVVISDRVRGVRLSEVLATAERQGLVLELNAALCLIRQLVSAMAAFHEAAPASCHGAIAPERILLTPEGRLIIADYVLGPALEELRISQERYWRELAIALPHTFGLPRFDLSADVTQIGAVALALVLGRRLAADEYPARIGDVVEQATARFESGQDEPLPVLLRSWIRAALQLEPRHSFVSAISAKKELEAALTNASPEAERAALRNFLGKYASVVMADRSADTTAASKAADAPAMTVPAMAVATGTVSSPSAASTPASPVLPGLPVSPVSPAMPGAAPSTPAVSVSAPSTPPAPPISVAIPTVAPASVAPPPAALPPVAPPPVVPPPVAAPAAVEPEVPAFRATSKVFEPMPVVPEPAPRPESRGRPVWKNTWAVAAAAAAVLIVATLGFTLLRPGSAAAPIATGTLAVNTDPQGVEVFIDGTARGATPLKLSLAPGQHVLELVTDGDRRRVPLTITAGSEVSHHFDLPKTTAGETGSLQLRTEPPRARVTVDGQPYGRTPTVVTGLTPGPHQVVLESDTERVSEQVLIEAGATASLVVPMQRQPAGVASGWIAVSAPAEVQIYENQRFLGSSRTDRIMVPAGRHELEMVNESLGFRGSRTVDVAAGQVATVRPEWPRGTVALNALPWAEVFVNGERLGETPIGSASLPIGIHEVVFRHPDLGERRASAIVTSGAPARLSVDMRTK